MAKITFTERDRGDDGRHGTPAGALRHSQAGEPPCDACRAAKAEYDREWRSASEQTRRNRMHAQAQRRALKRLKDAHPGEYRAFYLDEKTTLTAEHIRQRADEEDD